MTKKNQTNYKKNLITSLLMILLFNAKYFNDIYIHDTRFLVLAFFQKHVRVPTTYHFINDTFIKNKRFCTLADYVVKVMHNFIVS